MPYPEKYWEHKTSIKINNKDWNLSIEFVDDNGELKEGAIIDEEALGYIHSGLIKIIKYFGIPKKGEILDVGGHNVIECVIYDIVDNNLVFQFQY